MERTRYDLVIDGATRPASSGQRFETSDPANGEQLATVARGGADDVDAAVAAARRAFREQWRRMPVFDRARHVRALAEQVAEHAEHLVELESLDSGKSVAVRIRPNQ